MIVNCPNCATRLQLDDAKVPTHPFSVRCPKCEQLVNAPSASAENRGSALAAVGGLPATTRAQKEMSSAVPASVFAAVENNDQSGSAEAGGAEAARLLSELLRRGVEERASAHGVMRRPAWERRRALICVGSVHCQDVARALAAGNYEVFVAEKLSQASELLREERMDVIVLDAEFDIGEQGAVHINREVNWMRMAERRRLVFVQLSQTLRTGDAHAAFLNNVNLIVNTGDAAEIARALEKNVRDLNELYREFNRALNVSEL